MAAQANAVCRLGQRLYPNIALGAAGDQDTTDYAINRIVREIAAIATSPPSTGGRELEVRGQAAVAAWHSLATRREDTVAPGDKQEAARAANRYVDRLVALGAASLLPSGAGSRLLITVVLVNPVDAIRTASLLAIQGTTAFGAASLAFLRFTRGPVGAVALGMPAAALEKLGQSER